jgi:hypothetical protein
MPATEETISIPVGVSSYTALGTWDTVMYGKGFFFLLRLHRIGHHDFIVKVRLGVQPTDCLISMFKKNLDSGTIEGRVDDHLAAESL